MIKFACRCSHTFIVEDDQAGASMQCPQCGLLVDVPTLSDLPNLSSDGTYNLSELESAAESDRLPKLYRSFTRDHVDATTGEEIDLRLTPEEITSSKRIDPMQIKDQSTNSHPKYDPVTGELVRPIEVADDHAPNPANIPMAKSAIDYSTRYTQSITGFWQIALDLLSPINVAVMFFTSIFYLVGQFAFATVFLFALNIPLAALLLAHYGNVIEDTGPDLRDELPRPLRYFSWSEDIWRPFFRMFSSLVLCYAPTVFAVTNGLPFFFAGILALAGSIVLPAVMLTANTSGSLFNLRPDRIFNCIGIMGQRYFLAVGLWIAAVALHLWTWIGLLFLTEAIKHGAATGIIAKLNHPAVVYSMIAFAIYLMHLYCWYLGILYRRYQHAFPWVFQRHIPDPARKQSRAGFPVTGSARTLPPRGRQQFISHA